MLQLVNRDNDDFSYTSKNIKNTVDSVNKNVTRSSVHKSNINVNDSNIQSNNYADLSIFNLPVIHITG